MQPVFSLALHYGCFCHDVFLVFSLQDYPHMWPSVYVIAACFVYSFAQWLKPGNLCGISLLLDMLQPAVKANCEKILSDQSMGDLAKWKAMSQYLLDEKILYKMQLKPDALLVHPQNRGGMGLQVFSMHAKGQRILECGCDLQLLSSSTCIELHPDPVKKEQQIAFSMGLHQSHPTFVAPVLGHERYMSLSSTHVSQFFKAMSAACSSPEAGLVDSKTCKMSIALVSDAQFLKGIHEGWTWTVIPFFLEDAWV